MTVEGVVSVYRYKQRRRYRRGRLVAQPDHIITSVWVDDETAPKFDSQKGEPMQAWMIQAPRKAWPQAAAHEGHRVRVTATFKPYPIGARAMRARVECADEAEHVLRVLL